MTTNTYLTIEQAAIILMVTPYRMRELCRERKIVGAFKIGGHGSWRIPRTSVMPKEGGNHDD